MTVPARRAGRPAPSSAALLQPAVHRRRCTSSSTGSSRCSASNEAVLDVATGAQGRARGHRGARRRSSASRSPSASTCRSGPQPVEPEILAEGWYYDSTITAFMGGPGRAGASRRSPRSTARSSTAPSTASARACAAAARGLRVPPDRLRAQLRPRRGRRRRRPPRLLPHPGGRLMPRSLLAGEAAHGVATSPLTAAILLPFVGAVVVALVPRAASSCTGSWRSLFATGTGALTLWLLAAFETERRRLPVRGEPHVDHRLRDLLAPRHRRHLAVPRRAHRAAVPARHRRRRPAPRPEAVLRLAARPAGRLHRRVLRPRPVPVLRDVRDRARADVLPHRRLGLRRARLRRAQVLPLHDARLGADARRHREPRLPPPRRRGRGQRGRGRGDRAGRRRGRSRPRPAGGVDAVDPGAHRRGRGPGSRSSGTRRSTSTWSRSPSRSTSPTTRRAPTRSTGRRCAGSSSPSRSRSPSRCRCSRCTPGCPTPTPRRRPPAR